MIFKVKRRVYLDYAAATPIDRRVVSAMSAYFRKVYGNPSALHREGRAAHSALLGARGTIAECIGAHSDEIIFAGSGTEANNLAILGTIKKFFAQPDACTVIPHIVTTEIEHPSVLAVVKDLEAKGAAKVTYISVSNEGLVDPKEVKNALRNETVLVTVAYANSEIGVVQDIRAIAKVVRDWRKENKQKYPYFHTDACQAINYLDVAVERLGIDLMSFNAAKIYGPKGVGSLYSKRGVMLAPVIYGGGQEKGLRAGTENVAGIVGFAEALKITRKMSDREAKRLTLLRDAFVNEIKKEVPGAQVNGSLQSRLPNNVNISIPGARSAELVLRLDAKGVACSSKSACKSSDEEASYVVKALGKSAELAEGSVRFTLGRQTKREDIRYAVRVLVQSLETMKRTPLSA